MSIKQSERYKWVDIARGIGILLVVYAHAYPPTGIKILIYSFHIPLFFVLSGYCFKYADNIDFVTFIKKKFYSLIIPYIFLSAICIVLHFILSQFANNSYNYWKLILGIFIGIRGQEWMPVNTPMWFILALFVTNLIGFIVFKIAKKDSIRILLLTLVGVVGYAYVIKIGYRLPWGIDAAMVGSIFFGGGYTIRKNDILPKLQNSQYRYPILFASGFVFLLSAFFNGYIDMFESVYGNLILYVISGILGSYLLMILCQIMKSNSLLEYFGKNSIVYLPFHALFIFSILNRVLNHFGINVALLTIPGQLLVSVLYTIFAIVCITPLTIFFNKYLPQLIGKRKK